MIKLTKKSGINNTLSMMKRDENMTEPTCLANAIWPFESNIYWMSGFVRLKPRKRG